MRCPGCGATNPDSAAWCSLCLKVFTGSSPGSPAPPAGSPAPPPGPASPPVGSPARQPAGRPLSPGVRVSGRGRDATWTCPDCGTANPIDQTGCPTCGASLYRLLGSSEPGGESRPPRNHRVAAVLSVVPGLGHLYLGLGGQAAMRLLLAVWWAGTALAIDPAVGVFRPLRLIYVLALVALVAVSARDAQREAKAPGSRPLLDRRAVVWACGGLVALSVLWLILGTAAARR